MITGYITGKIEEKGRDRMSPDTVATETKGVVLDGAELRGKSEAVAAAADAFEGATAGRPGGSGG